MYVKLLSGSGLFQINISLISVLSSANKIATLSADRVAILAERERFELSEACTSPHFECGALVHYATSPSSVLRFS